MRILLLAPHPFYQERGTPIAVDLLIRALVTRCEQIDVLTYHEGKDLTYDGGVTIHRIRPPFGISGIRPGFTIKKLLCDAVMYPHASRLVRQQDYDCIHAVEEAAFMARRLGRRYGIPYVFDMDSSMPMQISDKIPLARPLLRIMKFFESRLIRDAAAVVPMCDALADTAREEGARHIEVLRDISLLQEEHTYRPEQGFREELGLKGPVILYLGNLETYQGIDLLLTGFAQAAKQNAEVSLVIAGGREEDIRSCSEQAQKLGIGSRVHFLGPRPIGHMPDLFHDSDILVSPRTQGNNTPMKIYSYLDSNRPVLATNLPTHSQVLSPDVAELVEPTAQAMSDGFLHLLNNDERRKALAEAAKSLAREKYSLPAFNATVNRIYDHIEEMRH